MTTMTRMPTFSRWMARWRPVRPRPAGAAAHAPGARTPPVDRDELPTCGWFDSSHELGQGLLVRELSSPESLAVVPLSQWLDWQLADSLGAVRH